MRHRRHDAVKVVGEHGRVVFAKRGTTLTLAITLVNLLTFLSDELFRRLYHFGHCIPRSQVIFERRPWIGTTDYLPCLCFRVLGKPMFHHVLVQLRILH